MLLICPEIQNRVLQSRGAFSVVPLSGVPLESPDATQIGISTAREKPVIRTKR
jgi:hypothetical protein